MVSICGRLNASSFYGIFVQMIVHVHMYMDRRKERKARSKGLRDRNEGAVIILEPLPIIWSSSLGALESFSSRLTVASFTYGNAHRLTRDGLALIGFGGTQWWREQPIRRSFTFDRMFDDANAKENIRVDKEIFGTIRKYWRQKIIISLTKIM